MSPLPPKVPAPRLRKVRNTTPFAHFACDKMGVGRRFHDTVVIKGTFDLAPGVLLPSLVQAKVALADTYWDPEAPERSSVKHAGEVVLVKPGTDVIVTGTARSPTGLPLPAWDVGVVVKGPQRTVLRHVAEVTGPRQWRHRSVRGWVLTEPEPAVEAPIRYELAYGGAYPNPGAPADDGAWIVHRPNPSGTGFFDERAMDTGIAYPAPRWQPHERPVTSINTEVPLTGFGPVARPWSARLGYSGTYDDAWLAAVRADVARGLPADYAADFDARFFQCAHPMLISGEHLRGDEHLGLQGMIHGQRQLVTRLPGISLRARLLPGRGPLLEERIPLDTVHVDLDAGAVFLCWRLTLDQARDIRAAEISTTEER